MLKFCIDDNNRQEKQMINRGLITFTLQLLCLRGCLLHVNAYVRTNFGIHIDRVDSDQTAPRGSLIWVYFSIVKLQFNILKIKTLYRHS